jgi:hypothetical protein
MTTMTATVTGTDYTVAEQRWIARRAGELQRLGVDRHQAREAAELELDHHGPPPAPRPAR